MDKNIDKLMNDSKYRTYECFGRMTMVAMMLPDGRIITGESELFEPESYNHDAGVAQCMDRIRDKIASLD